MAIEGLNLGPKGSGGDIDGVEFELWDVTEGVRMKRKMSRTWFWRNSLIVFLVDMALLSWSY